MALPIAQLGYMPNVSAPSPRQRQVIQDPWAALAMQVLSGVAANAVGNVMQPDYASQATSEAPTGASVGTPISPETGQPIGPASSTPLGPQNAPWYQKMLQGPTMGRQQYGQVSAQRAGAQEASQERTFKQGEGKENRALTKSEGSADRAMREKQLEQAAAQFGVSHDLGVDQLSVQKQIAEWQQGRGNAELAQGDRRIDTGVAESAADRASRENIAGMNYGRVPPALVEGAIKAENARRLMDPRGPQPLMTPQETAALYQALNQVLESQAPSAPSVKFNPVPVRN